MNPKLLLTGFARASFDIITHKNLRSPRSIRLRAVKNSSVFYMLFSYSYFGSAVILSLFFFSLVLVMLTMTFNAIDFLAVMFLSGLIYYFIPLAILYWIHSYWSNKLWVAGGGLDSEWKISIPEGEKRATLHQAIKDLQTLRAEVTEMEQQGIDVSDLIKEIEASDRKLLAEAKQDLSIEEIAKLQEEFVSSLDKENVA